MEAYSVDLRRRVLGACDQGEAIADAAEQFGVHRATIHRWLCRRRDTGLIEPCNQHVGRRRKLAEAHQRRLAALVRQRPDATLAQLHAALNRPVGVVTVWRALRRLKLTYKKRR